MALAANPRSRMKAHGDLPPLKVAKEFMQADKTQKAYKKIEKVKGKKNYGGKTRGLLRTKAKNPR